MPMPIDEIVERARTYVLHSRDGDFVNLGAFIAARVAELEAERDARKRSEKALRQKDAAMSELFRLLDRNGVDYSHLIP